MSITEIHEVISDPHVRGQYLAAIRHRGKDVLLKDIETMVDLFVGYLVDAELAERKEIELSRQVSALQLSHDNIINSLGIKGDGPVSKLVIEYAMGLVAENVALKASKGETYDYAQQFTNSNDREIWNSMHDVYKLSSPHETPATDAAIDEIKAQGVDEQVSRLESEYGEIDDVCELVFRDLREFAANLRAGRKG